MNRMNCTECPPHDHDDMCKHERHASMIHFMCNAEAELDTATHNASYVSDPAYRKINRLRNRLNIMIQMMKERGAK